jgi:hypothetical protein
MPAGFAAWHRVGRGGRVSRRRGALRHGARWRRHCSHCLLDALREAHSDAHVVYISIVGCDRIPLGYYRRKVAVEKALAGSGQPHTILRVTRFHDHILWLFTVQHALPLLMVPRGIRVRPIDVDTVAARPTVHGAGDASGRVADIDGPRIRTDQMIRANVSAAYSSAPAYHPNRPTCRDRSRASRGREFVSDGIHFRSWLGRIPCPPGLGKAMTGSVRSWSRAGVALLAVVQNVTGAWMTFAPRSFYTDVPTVADYPPNLRALTP